MDVKLSLAVSYDNALIVNTAQNLGTMVIVEQLDWWRFALTSGDRAVRTCNRILFSQSHPILALRTVFAYGIRNHRLESCLVPQAKYHGP